MWIMIAQGQLGRFTVHQSGGGTTACIRFRASGPPRQERDERQLARICDVFLAHHFAIGQKTNGSFLFAFFSRSPERFGVSITKFHSLVKELH